MKRFIVFTAGMELAARNLWHSAGFDVLPENRAEWPENANPDIIWIAETNFDALSVSQVELLSAKVLFARGNAVILLSEKWQSAYVLQKSEEKTTWVYGTKLETPLPDETGALLLGGETAALAECLYNYLLKDVFRETADWCGHMSSVVGRM